jgi:predicted dehydrogenase
MGDRLRRAFGGLTRREFVKSAAGVVGVSALTPSALATGAWSGGRERIRLGVIGCGGRGTGAVVDAMEADESVVLVAMADLFPDRLEGALRALAQHERFGSRIKVEQIERFTGFDGYRQLLNVDLDVVILATPPGFRPAHFEAAVAAGRHVFLEKPIAVDGPGIRRVLAAGELAHARGLTVVAGTQRRHDPKYRALMDQIHSGRIGEVVGGSCWWMQGGLWMHARKPEYSDMEWQCRNWLYFCWLSGDHIVEQHVHNLDVMNWAMGATPVRASGLGGREVRTGAEYGNIFDHFAVQYEYASGAAVMSMARQTDGCASRVDELITGTAGRARFGAGVIDSLGYKYDGARVNPYVQEHVHLFQSLRGSISRINETRTVAESTLTAIMGRLSAYTGQTVTWEQARESSWSLGSADHAFGALETDPVPVPGRTKLV